MKFQCVIVGLGNIGFKYDAHLKNSKKQLTHSKTIANSKNFELVAGIDANIENREKFSRKYSVPSYESLDDIPKNTHIDLIVICTSTDSHLINYKESIGLNPGAIMLEKPVAFSQEDVSEIVKLGVASGIKTFINYQRNYHPAFQELSKQIRTSVFEGPYLLTGWYTGGLKNSGSHLLSLVQLLLGDNLELQKNNSSDKKNMTLCDLSSKVNLHNIDNFNGSFFSFELLGSEAHVRYDSHLDSLNFSKTQSNDYYEGEYNLKLPFKKVKMKEDNCLIHVYKEIQNFFENKPYYICDLTHSSLTAQILDLFERNS